MSSTNLNVQTTYDGIIRRETQSDLPEPDQTPALGLTDTALYEWPDDGSEWHEVPLSGRVRVTPGDNIQERIDAAGKGGVVEFVGVSYTTAQPLDAHESQLWVTNNAQIKPSGDHPVLDFNGVFKSVFGPMRINDGEGATAGSTPLVRMREVLGSHFERLALVNPARGIHFDAGVDTNPVYENQFDDIWIIDVREHGIVSNGEVHDNDFVRTFVTGYDAGNHGILWNTRGVDGGNKWSQLTCINMGGSGFKIRNLHREMWFGDVILDSNEKHGLDVTLQDRRNRGLYFDTLWCSGNTENGFNAGHVGYSLRGLQVSQLFTIGNDVHGAYFDAMQDFQIGRHFVDGQANQDYGHRHVNTPSNGFVGAIQSFNNSQMGVEAPQGTDEVHIGRAIVDDGISATDFTSVNGDPMPEDLTSRTGEYDGQMKRHDGTDGSNTNSRETAVWHSGSTEWRGLYSGSVIA